MAAFNREIIDLVAATCKTGQDEIAQALNRTFDTAVQLTVGDSGAFDIDQPPAGCDEAGLILVLSIGAEAALVVLPDSSGFVPGWCRESNAESKSTLDTLANQLASLVLPEPYSAKETNAGYVLDIAAALRRAALTNEAGFVSIDIRCQENSGALFVIWPASQPQAVLSEKSADSNYSPTNPPEEPTAAAQKPAKRQRPRIEYQELEEGLAQLPCYSRSLLKIKVPVMVTLAEAKQPVENVLNIGPGSIIHFSKPCEDTLTLEIAGQKIAVGEAVKVGDKFGLWITSMILPEERFWILSNRSQTERAK